MKKENRKRERRKCDPNKCKEVLKERRKANSERRKAEKLSWEAYKEKVKREYHEDYANQIREGMKELARRIMNKKAERDNSKPDY